MRKRVYSDTNILERYLLIYIFPCSERITSRVFMLEVASQLGSKLLTKICSPVNHILFMIKLKMFYINVVFPLKPYLLIQRQMGQQMFERQEKGNTRKMSVTNAG
jgi:hypothetical protein